jgi:hypothetical protein
VRKERRIKIKADKIIRNAKIFTADKDKPKHTASV